MNYVLRYNVHTQRPNGYVWIGADIYGTPGDLQRMLDGYIAAGLRKGTIKDVRVSQSEPEVWVEASGFTLPLLDAPVEPVVVKPKMQVLPVTWGESVPAPRLNMAWQFEDPK